MNTQISQKTLLVKRAYLKEIAPLSKSYAKGDKGYEVLKIKELLMIWQLDYNYVDKIVELDDDFDSETEVVVKEMQASFNLDPTGIVDADVWEKLILPLKEAFSTNYYNIQTLPEKVKYFATKHLQFRSAELDKDNLGPWVRSYMDGQDGKLAYWCQGFACTILDQAFSSIGKRFDQYYANTLACEDFRKHARDKKLLVTQEDLLNKKYLPKVGDIVLYIEGAKQEAHHTEIIYQVLDGEKGVMLTIGGNTNFSGSRDGVGTYLVNRNFLTDNVEVAKIIDEKFLENP